MTDKGKREDKKKIMVTREIEACKNDILKEGEKIKKKKRERVKNLRKATKKVINILKMMRIKEDIKINKWIIYSLLNINITFVLSRGIYFTKLVIIGKGSFKFGQKKQGKHINL